MGANRSNPSTSWSTGATERGRRACSRAFTLIDVLVTLSIVAVLIGLLMPSLALVRETARRVKCSANLRSIGLGLVLYAEENQGRIPFSFFAAGSPGRGDSAAHSELMHLRFDPTGSAGAGTTFLWDGLGLLFAHDYLNAGAVFYCPSHSGMHPYSRYAERFGPATGRIIGNFQYRGSGPNGSKLLSDIEPRASALVADGMRTILDYNHKIGCNVLSADLAVRWVSDADGSISSLLASDEASVDPTNIADAWEELDNSRK